MMNSSKPTDVIPNQPSVRSGELIAAEGRWNQAAAARIRKLTGADLTWTEGTLGFSVSLGDVVIGRLNRHMRGRPWTVRIHGFERWHAPTRIIPEWHYTPVWAAATLREAKRQVASVIRAIPDLEIKQSN